MSWSRNRRGLYVHDALADFHYDPKVLPSPIAQRKIYRSKLISTHLVGFGGGVSIGGTSYSFDGTTDFLSSPDHANWRLGTSGTGNFTIEAWVRNWTGGDEIIFGQLADTNDGWRIAHDGAAIQIRQRESSVSTLTHDENWSPSADTWYHFAWIRGWGGQANDFAITIDGTILGSADTDAADIADFGYALGVGGHSTASLDDLSGNMDEIRISNTARWTTNFSPSTVEYTSDANTHLLIHCNEALTSGTTGSGAVFNDSGNTTHAITENGNAIRDTTIFKI
tara:strand:+ start:5403 stop:6245 length:843 start_codon:yes stop_codon:yes gene_type:complete